MSNSDTDLPDQPMCARCFDFTDKLYPSNCDEKPELLAGHPIGMYHCRDCGTLLVAGLPHPEMCRRCAERKHPSYDLFSESKR